MFDTEFTILFMDKVEKGLLLFNLKTDLSSGNSFWGFPCLNLKGSHNLEDKQTKSTTNKSILILINNITNKFLCIQEVQIFMKVMLKGLVLI